MKTLTPIPELTYSELQKLIAEAEKPVIAEFFTHSCIPCKRISPLLEEIRRYFSNKLTVARLDIEKHPAAAARYDVAAVPTVLVLINGHTWLRIVGSVTKKDLLRVIHENILTIDKS